VAGGKGGTEQWCCPMIVLWKECDQAQTMALTLDACTVKITSVCPQGSFFICHNCSKAGLKLQDIQSLIIKQITQTYPCPLFFAVFCGL